MDSKAREINPPDTIKNKLGMLTKKGNEHGERRENEKVGIESRELETELLTWSH